jgi:hypothetical protein
MESIATLMLLAQAGGGSGGAAQMIILLIELGLVVLTVAGMWAVFAKAGKPGWAAIIPIYNVIVLLEIADKPIWWIILFLIPCVNLIVALFVSIAVAEKFGQGAGFGVGLWLLGFVFYPILGFGDYQYEGGLRRRYAVEED